jgi:hypothetical protein
MLPTFPDFKPLTLDDRAIYDAIVADYPPLSDISFTTLQIWWNLGQKLAVSLLNGNLVINYHLPFDIHNSGYSLIGNHAVEESVQTIFSLLKAQNKPQRLVHVPEFVIQEIRHPGFFSINEELDYNEYILDARSLAKLEGSPHRTTRREVNHFLNDVSSRDIRIKPLDISSQLAINELCTTLVKWRLESSSTNDPMQSEYNAIKIALNNADVLDMQHLGLYVDDVLHGFLLYHQTANKNYYLLSHLKVSHAIPYVFDFMIHHIALEAIEKNVSFLNIEMDLGIENLRQHKLRLRPVDFFRKYCVSTL